MKAWNWWVNTKVGDHLWHWFFHLRHSIEVRFTSRYGPPIWFTPASQIERTSRWIKYAVSQGTALAADRCAAAHREHSVVNVTQRRMDMPTVNLTIDAFIALLHQIRREIPPQYQEIASVSFDADVEDVFSDGETLLTRVFMSVDYVKDIKPEGRRDE